MKQNLATDLSIAPVGWQRTLVVLWLAQSAAMIGITASLPFLPLAVRDFGISDERAVRLWGAALGAAPFALSMFITPIWGRLSDRFGQRVMLIRAALGLIVFNFLAAHASSLGMLLLLRFLQGGFTGIVPSSLAMASVIAPRERSGFAISMMQNSVAISSMIGPLVGGVWCDTIGARSVFYLASGLSAISLLLVVFGVQEPPRVEPSKESLVNQRPFLALLRRTDLAMVLFLITLCQTAISFSFPLIALYMESRGAARDSLGLSAGFAVAAMGIATALMSPRWGRTIDRSSPRRALLVALPGFCLLMALHSLARTPGELMAIRFGLGLFSSAILPSLYVTVQRSVSAEERGSAMGLASTASIVGHLVGPLVGGASAALIGFEFAFCLASALGIIALALVARYWPAERSDFRPHSPT